MTQRLTREQAAVISAYTGYLAGPFSDMHEYIERVMGRPVWTHEMGDGGFVKKVQEASKADFLAITAEDSK